jgi:hypothetical protein
MIYGDRLGYDAYVFRQWNEIVNAVYPHVVDTQTCCDCPLVCLHASCRQKNDDDDLSYVSGIYSCDRPCF